MQPAPSPALDAGVQPYAPPQQPAPSPPAFAGDQYAQLMQALQQRQIPPLPNPSFGIPAAAPPIAPAAAPQPDALALLSVILSNPQFQQTLQMAAGQGGRGPRSVPLPLPVQSQPQQMRSTQVPLGAVMNAIAMLAGRSMTELNATTREDDPEVPPYLVDEQGEFVVDPASSDDRAALVTHLFRVSEQAQLAEQFQDAEQFEEAEQLEDAEQFQEAGEADEDHAEVDEWDEFARDAGFPM